MVVIGGEFYLDPRVLYKRETLVVTLERIEITGT